MRNILFLLIFLTSCSGINKQDAKVENNDFNMDLTFDDFKKKIILYGKTGDFPDIDG